jgi:hypothetical protein
MGKNNKGGNTPKQTRTPRATTVKGTVQNAPNAGAGEAVQEPATGDTLPPLPPVFPPDRIEPGVSAENFTAPVIGETVVDTGAAPDVNNPDVIAPAEGSGVKIEPEKTGTVQTLTADDGTTRETVIDEDSIIDPATLSDEDKANAVDGEWVAEKIGPYLDAYPDEKEFHITSDGQVFLKAGHRDALEHQKHLKDGKEVVSFIVEKA